MAAFLSGWVKAERLAAVAAAGTPLVAA